MGNNKKGQVVNKAPSNPLGLSLYKDEHLGGYVDVTHLERSKRTRNEWTVLAYVLAIRAKKLAQTGSVKDWSALYKLVYGAAIAFDKAFPKVDAPGHVALVVNLFGSLGSPAVRNIIQPEIPVEALPEPVDVEYRIEQGSAIDALGDK